MQHRYLAAGNTFLWLFHNLCRYFSQLLISYVCSNNVKMVQFVSQGLLKLYAFAQMALQETLVHKVIMVFFSMK